MANQQVVDKNDKMKFNHRSDFFNQFKSILKVFSSKLICIPRKMSRQQHHHSEDGESEDSLIAQIDRRQNQRLLTHYLSDHIKQSPQINDISLKLNPNHQKHPGFSSANQLSRPLSKQKHQTKQIKFSESIKQKTSLNQSSVTVSNQNIKSNDSKLNKQLQKPILKDIEDLGNNLKDNCNGCEQNKPAPGLNYKNRNKRLIEEYERKIYSKKKPKQEEAVFKTPQKNDAQRQKKEYVDFKQSLNQFLFSQNKDNQPQNILLNAVKEGTPNDPNIKYNFIIDKSKISNQEKLTISNHTVYFPYQPYDAQINYMGKVIQSLDKKQNAILQSPTGTGKTLCLLSAALSWVQNNFWKSYKEVSIIYLSRTHSQLAQVSKELEKTCFRPTMATFGSREIFCIKQNFKELKGREKVEACNKAVKLYLKYGKQDKGRHVDLKFDDAPEENNDGVNLPSSQKKLSDMPQEEQQKIEESMCEYYRGERYVLDLARNKFKNKIISNQKIKQLGKAYKFCPYYYPTFIKPICNLFLMPYNYLLDCELNSKYASIVKNSILIFDQAHNVPESSCEGRSFSINKRTFEDALKQLNKLMKGQRMSNQLFMVLNDYSSQLNTFEYEIKRILNTISNFVAEVEFPANQTVTEDDSSMRKLFNIHETEQTIYEFLYEKLNDSERKVFMNLPNDKSVKELISKMIKDIERNVIQLSQLCQDLSQTPDGIFQNMEKVSGFVKKCIGLIQPNNDDYKWIDRQVNHFRVVVTKNDKNWEVSLVCLVPFLTMKSIMQMEPRNIILTSGTLSPIETWQSQLSIPFPIRFTNTHVISPNQLMLRIVTNQDKQTFNFSYKYLQDNFKTIYQMTLRSIIQLAQNIPNGMLVVTPSYKVLNSLERCMQYNTDLRKRLNSTKKIFTQTKDNFEDLIKKFRKAALQPKGALLFCVCRGKISQGIDFPNELCRSVIFVGIPFPNVSDIILSEKKNHYDRIGQQDSTYKFTGNKWYENITFRSVNQAIGRVIRHINDYGSIFLLDIRYNMQGYKSQLPKWSQSSLKTIQLKSQVFNELENFYRNMEEQFSDYRGKNELDKTQEQFQQNEYFSQDKNSNNKKFQKPTQKNPEKQYQKNGQKYEEKRVVQNNYFNRPSRNEMEKKGQKNAFTTIMGTNQGKYVKKKANFGSNQADKF